MVPDRLISPNVTAVIHWKFNSPTSGNQALPVRRFCLPLLSTSSLRLVKTGKDAIDDVVELKGAVSI